MQFYGWNEKQWQIQQHTEPKMQIDHILLRFFVFVLLCCVVCVCLFFSFNSHWFFSLSKTQTQAKILGSIFISFEHFPDRGAFNFRCPRYSFLHIFHVFVFFSLVVNMNTISNGITIKTTTTTTDKKNRVDVYEMSKNPNQQFTCNFHRWLSFRFVLDWKLFVCAGNSSNFIISFILFCLPFYCTKWRERVP